MATITGFAFYAKVQAPGSKFQKEGSNDPIDFEYSIDVLVDAKVQKAFYKKYSDQKGKSAEPLEPQDFEKKYGVDPSTLDASPNSDGEYTIIKLKTGNAYKDYKTGEAVMMQKPKVFFVGDNGKLQEDTETLVGNGSKVTVQFIEYESKKWKTVSAKLRAIKVIDLVPYGGGDDFSELGDIDESTLDNSTPEFKGDDGGGDEFGSDSEVSEGASEDSSEDDDDEFGFS